MEPTTPPFPLRLDDVDAIEAHSVYLEFFSDDDVLNEEQGRLAGRLAVFVAAFIPTLAGPLPEDAARFVRERIDPGHPGEPLSFHLRRAYYRRWIDTGADSGDDSHRWLPLAGGFALDGLRLRREPSRELLREFAEELRSPGAIPFWALNLTFLAEDDLGEEPGRAIRAGVLGHLIRLARDGELGEAHTRAVGFYADWSRSNPRGLASLLARVDEEVPGELSVARSGADDGVVRQPGPDDTVSFQGLLGVPLWPKDWGTENLLRALRRHAVLRESLLMLLWAAGFELLDTLPVDERVEVLSLSPEIMAAAFRPQKGAAPDWLRGRAALIPVVDRIDDAMGGAHIRARAYAAIDLPEVLPALDRDLAHIADAPRGYLSPIGAIVDSTRCRGALEWLRRLVGFNAWCDALSGSARIQAALWVKPEAFRELARERGYLPVHALAVAARREPSVAVSLARRILTGWEELPGLARGADGEADVDTLHLLCLSGTPVAIEEAISIFPELQVKYGAERAEWLRETRASGFEIKESPEVSQAIEALSEPLRDMPWVPDAFLAGIAPHLGPAFATVFSSAQLDGPPDQSARLVNLRTFYPSEEGGLTVRALLRLAQSPEKEDFLPRSVGVGVPLAGYREERAIERLIAGGEPDAVAAFIKRVVPVEELGGIPLRNGALVGLVERLQGLLRRFETPFLAEITLEPLVDADLSELAPALVDAFVSAWPEGEADLSRVLAACRARVERQLADALRKEGLEPIPRMANIADAGFGREALREILSTVYPALDATARDRVLDRAGDELRPRLARAALRALAAGERPWDGGASVPARVVSAIVEGPWRREPTALARALRDVLNDLGKRLSPSSRAVWARAIFFALGKLREPIGGKIPNLLHAYAKDPVVPEDVRAAASTQEALFDADRMNIQRRYSPEQRVQQALASLREAGRRVDGPRAAEVIVRPAHR